MLHFGQYVNNSWILTYKLQQLCELASKICTKPRVNIARDGGKRLRNQTGSLGNVRIQNASDVNFAIVSETLYERTVSLVWSTTTWHTNSPFYETTY